MKKKYFKILPLVDVVFSPIVYISAKVLKIIRSIGIQKFPNCKKILFKVGVFPINNHYYEPQFIYEPSTVDFNKTRILPGINWNIDEQLQFLTNFKFSQELINLPIKKQNNFEFYLNNGAFLSGDAEYLYQLIRFVKPKRIFEVGSGNSTLLAKMAIIKNHEDNAEYRCKHVCIEPFEMPWLEQIGVTLIRNKVESIEPIFFSELEENDILFIDSSHMIRPQGDVLFEFLEILPTLNKGVIVHVHDIFSPNNYPKEWIINEIKFWNEQYLLEAFLSNNNYWKIIGSLNLLHHMHYEELKTIAPFLTPDREPGSFYIQKTI